MTNPLVPIEDVLAVQDLLGRYCWYVDENMGEQWASLYTPDGIFEGTRPEPVIGHEVLAKVPGQLAAHFQGRMRHQVGNLFIDLGETPNQIVARFYNQISTWGMDGWKQAADAGHLHRDPGAGGQRRRVEDRAQQHQGAELTAGGCEK